MIRSYKEEQELKEKILELRKKNYPYDKIAMELGTNESRVKLIIGLLVEEGKLDSLATNLYKKETEEKLKQILSMAKAKRNVSEISSSLGISVDRTYLYLDRLVEEGRLSIAEVYQCADEEIEKRVIELRKAGLGQREIMKEMKITKQDTLRRILDKLFSEGKIDSYKKVDKTKKRIVELLKYGYNAEEISRQLVKDEQNIRSLMAELIRDGVVTQDEITQAREAKKEEIIELIRQGKGRREIIQKIGIKYKDLGDFLREIIESGELKKNKESSKVNRRDLIEQDDGR
jgi:predicted ArsR family transcriptional regulator